MDNSKYQSRKIFQREENRNLAIFKQKILNVKTKIDNIMPNSVSCFTTSNSRKNRLKTELQQQIDKNNDILLERMLKIMQKKQKSTVQNNLISLNYQQRKQKQIQINTENKKIYQRLKQCQPSYNRKDWEQSFQTKGKLTQNNSFQQTKLPSISKSPVLGSFYLNENQDLIGNNEEFEIYKNKKMYFRKGKPINNKYCLIEIFKLDEHADRIYLSLQELTGQGNYLMWISNEQFSEVLSSANHSYDQFIEFIRVHNSKLWIKYASKNKVNAEENILSSDLNYSMY